MAPLFRRFPTSDESDLRHISLPLAGQDSACPLLLSFALLTASLSLSSPAGTKIFQFPACAHATIHGVHSAILGSRADLRLPKAYRSLPRPSSLSEPSHPLNGLKISCLLLNQLHHAISQLAYAKLEKTFARHRNIFASEGLKGFSVFLTSIMRAAHCSQGSIRTALKLI